MIMIIFKAIIAQIKFQKILTCFKNFKFEGGSPLNKLFDAHQLLKPGLATSTLRICKKEIHPQHKCLNHLH